MLGRRVDDDLFVSAGVSLQKVTEEEGISGDARNNEECEAVAEGELSTVDEGSAEALVC